MKPFFIIIFLGISSITFLLPKAIAQDNNQSPQNNGSNNIQLNFRGVPLEQVLDYLSEVAGFVIVKEADLDGEVDVWSHQPLNQEEVINLLNTVLYQKGYAAIRNGRTLTIVEQEEAKKRDIPVRSGNQPEAIPKTDEMITQIVPVRYTDATALIENLEELMPNYATLTANESSNAIVVTDTQTHVRRIVEIIRALDTSISSISAVQVFYLQYSDATEIADMLQELFETEEDNDRGGGRFPGPFGRGRGDDDDDRGESEARNAASRIVAVADERSNSVVVSAPEDYLPLIEMIIKDIDTNIEDITEIRVFKLQYADATEMANLITELFPDESSEQQQFAPRFGRFGGPPFGPQGDNQNQDSSSRQLKQTSVRCEPDPRTNSIVVTAAQATVAQIEQMILELDKNPEKKHEVHVFKLKYADVENVANLLRSLFEEQYTGTNTNINQNANTLSNRTVQENTDTSPFNTNQ